jgi:hypothetical protein
VFEVGACLHSREPASLHATVSQPELLLAAAWPRETLQQMAYEPSSPIASERLYASLMHRRDILAELNGLILGSSNSSAPRCEI